MKTGIIKWFDFEKGFGFIESEDGEELFLHKSEIKENELDFIKIGKVVTFKISDHKLGKLAVNVSLKENKNDK